jgi:hypothetical protein
MNASWKSLASLICLLLIFISGELGSSANSSGGVRVGNGGDWRRIMLGQAQREAANWVNTAALNREMFAQDEQLAQNPIVQRLVMQDNVLLNLASDIVSSSHIYHDSSEAPRGEYTTCAWTNDPSTPSLNDIVFSLNLCEVGLHDGGQSFANRLLIHESVHHILRDEGLRKEVGAIFSGTKEQQAQQEDRLCDDFALAIQRIFELVGNNGKPHWRDLETPYFTIDGKEYTFEPRGFHATAWTGPSGETSTRNRMIIWGGCREGEATIYACGGNQYFNDGAIYNQAENSWKPISTHAAPSSRAESQSAWTGDSASLNLSNLFVVWGGCRDGDGCKTRLADGGVYNMKEDQWTPIPASSASPSPRVHHTLVWTGSQMIVWGGHPNDDNPESLTPPTADGGIYDLVSKTWQKIPADSPEAPKARAHHFAVWTGDTGNELSSNKMLILGGCVQEIADACSKILDDGAFFDPETMKWSKINTAGQHYVPRHNGSFLHVPSQNRVYIFGGFDSDSNVISEGLILDLKTLRFQKMAAMAEGRFKHRAVWAGDKMLIFGGKIYGASRTYELASSVLGYVPGALGSTSPGVWKEFNTDEMIPLKAIESSAVWTGSSMLIWGGQVFDRGFTNYGSEFFTGW